MMTLVKYLTVYLPYYDKINFVEEKLVIKINYWSSEYFMKINYKCIKFKPNTRLMEFIVNHQHEKLRVLI